MSYPVQPYFPLQIAANLRFLDSNGNPVTQLPLTGLTPQLDNPQTGYVSLIGATVSQQVTQIAQINDILDSYAITLASLQQQITAINTSGATALPNVNGGCLSTPAGSSVGLATATTLLLANSCAYNSALGTPTQISNAILAQCANLNTLPAYSQNSAMAGLPGWNSTVTNLAQAFQNMELAYCDMRAGVTQALSQSSITCADIIINYQGVYSMTARTITVYFYTSSIPANFSASGSSSGTFRITDTVGNVYTQSFNLYTTVAVGSIVLNVSSSALLQNSSYDVVLTYALTSTTPALGCNGSIPNTVVNNTATCPVLTAAAEGTTSITYTFTPTLVQNVTYSVSLINSSGSTSGGTVLATETYNSPLSPVNGSFTGLTINTLYFIRMTVISGAIATTCPLVSQTTSSS